MSEMPSTTTYPTGFLLFFLRHIKLKHIHPSLILHPFEEVEEHFLQVYKELPEIARSLWCAEDRGEPIVPPDVPWDTFPEALQQYCTLRALEEGQTWSVIEAADMGDPGFRLFTRRHELARASPQQVFNHEGYPCSIAELWDDTGSFVQALWRADAMGLIEEPSVPATDAFGLWIDYQATVYGEEGYLGDEKYEMLMRVQFNKEGQYVQDFWALKAFELRETDSAESDSEDSE